MYTRNYYSEDEKIIVPENYDGNAFPEKNEPRESSANKTPALEAEMPPPLRAPWDVTEKGPESASEEVMAKPKEHEGFFGDFMNKLPFGNIFKKGDFMRSTFSDFGMEELLIIGIALFLLLSKDGDKECAFILLFLLFVK